MYAHLVGNTHIVAGTSDALADVIALLEKEGVAVRGNPDVYVRSYGHFGVGEARELRERAILRPLGERRIFAIAAPDIGREAQNALLKTIEEPPAGAIFIFIVPSPEALLPTFRSRAQMLVLERGSVRQGTDAKQFLAAFPSKRLDLLKPLLEKGDDDKRDLAKILEFLGDLERLLAKHPNGSLSACREGLESVYRARKYVADKGALVKPLLEQVALLAPQV